jgi:phosphopantetheine adenylyltransferase
METIDDRIAHVRRFLETVRRSNSLHQLVYDVCPIFDDFGPTRDDKDIQALVGSGETLKGCLAGACIEEEI